jgi:hypothetical protein
MEIPHVCGKWEIMGILDDSNHKRILPYRVIAYMLFDGA